MGQGAKNCVYAVTGILDEHDVGWGGVDVRGERGACLFEQLLVTATEPCLEAGGMGGGGVRE
jgi:hypothetical protein